LDWVKRELWWKLKVGWSQQLIALQAHSWNAAIHRFSELLNKVWDLEGCPLKGQTMRTNRSVRFGFYGLTVLLGCQAEVVWLDLTDQNDQPAYVKHPSLQHYKLC
jgi:hypothetical protein